MSVVKFEDIVALAKPTRPILPEDKTWIEGKIVDAEILLENRRGDLATWIAAGPDPEQRRVRVVHAVNRMIERVVKNPDGLFTETDGNYSYGRDRSLASGEVYVSGTDWAFVGFGARRVSSVRTGLPAWSPRNMSCG